MLITHKFKYPQLPTNFDIHRNLRKKIFRGLMKSFIFDSMQRRRRLWQVGPWPVPAWCSVTRRTRWVWLPWLRPIKTPPLPIWGSKLASTQRHLRLWRIHAVKLRNYNRSLRIYCSFINCNIGIFWYKNIRYVYASIVQGESNQ